MQFPAWKPSQLSNACQPSPVTSNNSLTLTMGTGVIWALEAVANSGYTHILVCLPTLTFCFSIHFRACETGINQQDGLISQNHISILMFDLNSIILSGSSSISPLLKCRFNNTEVISLWRVILKIDLWLIQ